MSASNMDTLVDGQWLQDRLGDPKIRIADASWFFPGAKKNARVEYEKWHIPGAVQFDIDDIADPDTTLPHMVPDAERFQKKVGALGIGPDDTVVVYDSNGGGSAAARAWWLLRLFGHKDARFLDGGLPAWLKEGRPLEKGIVQPDPKSYTGAVLDEKLLRRKDDILRAVESNGEIIVDVRSAGRFNGTEPEPRPGLRGGHIPGSVNLPFPTMMRGNGDCRLKPLDELRQVFTDCGLDITKPMVISCGSGVTACLPALALHLLGNDDYAIYDGSWTEWGGDETLPSE